MEDEAEYKRLKANLAIDLTRLDEALITLPMDQMAIAEYTAAASAQTDAAKFELDRVMADVAASLRQSDEKISEAKIKTEVFLFDEVQAANTALANAQYEYTLWRGLADATRSKSRSIEITSDLIKSGYLTTATIYADRRETIHQHRMSQRTV